MPIQPSLFADDLPTGRPGRGSASVPPEAVQRAPDAAPGLTDRPLWVLGPNARPVLAGAKGSEGATLGCREHDTKWVLIEELR